MNQQHRFSFGGFTTTVSLRCRDELYDDIAGPLFFVADTNTERFVPAGARRHILAAGERSKSWTEIESLVDILLHADLARDGCVVGVGGGVTTDVSGFAASIYMRGCRLVLVPTTLLGMVDAALGGKTGINASGYKNMVGTFYPAEEVRLCPDLLHTLPEREYLSGLAEVIKSAMLGDVDLLDTLERDARMVQSRDDDLLADVVWRCVLIKGAVVESDLRETEARAQLNLGHTFGHALESQSGFSGFSHGEAVAWGIARAMEAGVAAGLTPDAYGRRVITLLEAYGYRIDPLPDMAAAMLDAMHKDKKRRGGVTRFVLQKGPGETVIAALDDDLVRKVLEGRGPNLRG